MSHPLLALPPSHRRALLLIALAAGVALIGVFRWTNSILDPTGYSGVAYQLAGSAPRSWDILFAWGPYGRTVAAFSLGIDYLFLVCYSTVFALGCLWAAEQFAATLGLLLAWGQWLAALLDAGENTALLTMMFGSPSDTLARTARWCSLGKFGLLTLGLAYIVTGALTGIIEKWRRPSAHRSAASGS